MKKTLIRLPDETRKHLDEVTALLHRRGLDCLPPSVLEEALELTGERGFRLTQPMVVHLALVALRRHLDLEEARKERNEA